MTLNRIYIALLAAFVVVAFKPPAFIEAFELKIYDLFTVYSAPSKPDPRVVIVGVDEDALDAFGRWPWPRSVIGDLVTKLSKFGASVIALDMTFTTQTGEKTSDVVDKIESVILNEGVDKRNPEFYEKFVSLRDDFSKDEYLAEAIGKAGNVVSGFLFHRNRSVSESVSERKREIIRPYRIKLTRRDAESRKASIDSGFAGVEPNIPIIQKASAATGFLNVEPDRDGVFRSYSMLVENKGDFYPSMALASVMLYREALSDAQVLFRHGLFKGVDVGGRMLETDESGAVLLRYLGPDGTFPTISVADIMATPDSDTSMRKILEGKIALVGATATQIYDLRATPFGITAGVEVQANAMAAALESLYISKFGWQSAYDAMLTLVLGLILLFILRRVNVYAGLGFTALMFAALVGFNYLVFSRSHVWLNSVIPSGFLMTGFITVTVYHYISEQKSKRFIQDAFGKYLSPKVINQIIENPGLLTLGGEKRVMTAFFSDIAGFTTLSEKLQPTELVSLLNEYLSAMTDIILELDGTVDKYEGDAIIAFWGAPLPIENHAELCVLAAARMQEKLDEMAEGWTRKGLGGLRVRMGINTGPMVVGNMGSTTRMDYTMMGDSVNLAARLEGANKYYGSRILVSEFTRALIKDRFLTRELDKVRVAGKKDAIKLYEVVGLSDDVSGELRRATEIFENAIKAFRKLDLEKAEELFRKCDSLRGGGDIASQLYIERIAELKRNPPSADWDYVYDLAK